MKGLIFLLVMGLCLACSPSIRELPQGNFLRAIGNKIYIVNFETGKDELVYTHHNSSHISHKMSQVDEKTIMFSVGHSHEVFILNLDTKIAIKLGVALNPVYMNKHEKIVYYGKDKDGRGALLISKKDFSNPTPIYFLKNREVKKIIKISADEVVFQRKERAKTGGDWHLKVWKYNVVTGELKGVVGFKGCRIFNVWRSTKGQLICRRAGHNSFGSYYLIDLQSSKETQLEYRGYLDVGEYVEELDSLIIKKTAIRKGSEELDLWLYNLNDGSEKLLMTNSGFGVDSFVRLED